MEKKIEAEAVKWLKSKGAIVIKNKSGPGVPVGFPDRLFLFEGAWGVIEFKRSARAPYRVGQKAVLKRLGEWSPFVYTVYPENWLEIKADLLQRFF